MAKSTGGSSARPGTKARSIAGLRRRPWAMVLVAVVILAAIMLAGCAETEFPGQQRAFLWQNGVMTDLGTLGGESSLAYGISPSSRVTGWAQTAAGDRHAFVWYRGKMTDLGTLGGALSVGRDINKFGHVAGWSTTADGYEHAVLWRGGRLIDLGTLGGDESRAYGLDDVGHVVGWAQTADGSRHAFLWSGKTMKDLGTLADTESQAFAVQLNSASTHWWRPTPTVVGSVGVSSPVAAVWRNGSTQTFAFPDSVNGKAYGINFNGQVVGEADTTDIFAAPHPFVWRNGTIRDLGLLAGTDWGRAYAINSRGDCAGECVSEALGHSYATAWIDGQIIDLGFLPAGNEAMAYDINDKRQIVGACELVLLTAATQDTPTLALSELTAVGVDLDAVTAVHVVGVDAAGQTVYETVLTGSTLQQAITTMTLDPAPPSATVRLIVQVTYVDDDGIERSETFDYALSR